MTYQRKPLLAGARYKPSTNLHFGGRLFRADGEKVTFTPFGDLDFIVLKREAYVISGLEQERDVLVIHTEDGSTYELHGAYGEGASTLDWNITRR